MNIYLGYLFLVLVLVGSFLSFYLSKYIFIETADRDYFFMHFLPGFLFSAFLIFMSYRRYSFAGSFKNFVILNLIYIVALYVSIGTWGVFVPVVGGIGAWLIWLLFFRERRSIVFINKFLVSGFLSGVLGLISFFLLEESVQFSLGFALIVVIWQVVIGIIFIEELKLIES